MEKKIKNITKLTKRKTYSGKVFPFGKYNTGMVNKKILKKLKDKKKKKKKKKKPEKVFLFGSFATGRAKKNSDVDLLVIKKTKERFTKRLLQVSGLVNSPMGTDILVYTPKEWKSALKEENYFVREIAQTGKLLYDRENKK